MAREVFREFGFEKSAMAKIAARLGGSKATLYATANEQTVRRAPGAARTVLNVAFLEARQRRLVAHCALYRDPANWRRFANDGVLACPRHGRY
ncbi:hypothetical protein ABIC66_000218 [Caulobacter sp. 1776]